MKLFLSLSIFGVLAILISANFNGIGQNKFYYAYDEKIVLSEIDDKLIVKIKSNQINDIKSIFSQHKDISEQGIVRRDDSTFMINVPSLLREQIKVDLSSQKEVIVCNTVYQTFDGAELGFTDSFIFKLKEDASLPSLLRLNEKHRVEIKKAEKYYYILKVQPGVDALEMSNLYYESGLAEYSHPNFFSDINFQQAANDPYYNNQFYLHNTGQVIADGRAGTADADIDAPEAWTVTTGSSTIIVAVLDQGVTSDHIDLPNTRQVRLNGSNFGDGNSNDPSPSGNQNHGNACAGIIGATRNNNLGISGIAPNVRIMPIRIQDGFGTSQIVAAIDFAYTNGAHVLSNSWTLGSQNPNHIPAIRDAIIRATTLGRGGLGAV